MDQRTDDLRQSIEEKQHDIEETRTAMTEKLELLEERVRETMEDAKTAVDDIVENVKGTVDETVEAVRETVGGARSTVEDIVENVKDTMDDTVTMVKQSFDLRHQVEQRPWLMLGGSVLAGYMLGGLLGRRSSMHDSLCAKENDAFAADMTSGSGLYSMPGDSSTTNFAREQAQAAPSQPQKSGVWDSTLGQFREEFDIIKGAVVGSLMNNLRDVIKENLPSIAPQLEKVSNSAKTKMGAQPSDSSEHARPESNTKADAGRQSPYTPYTSAPPTQPNRPLDAPPEQQPGGSQK
jgi:ElaB/YqjD/DUF883 family membrane-anchored ribosome-binding protein